VTKPDLFQHQDYRRFLRQILQFRRIKQKQYNLSKMAKAFGFSSHAGLAMILNGQRDLRPPYLDKAIDNLKLTVNERLYFEAMVRAGVLSEGKRQNLLREVQLLTKTWEPPHQDSGIRLLDYGLVHQILCLHHRFLTIAEIVRHFRYPLSEKAVHQILAFMLERNQIVASPDGLSYRTQTDVLLVKDEVPNVPGQQMHKDGLQLAQNALSDPIEKREFQTFILTIDSKRLTEMKKKIKEMVQKIVAEYETSLDADTVVQIHTHLFEPIHNIKKLKSEGTQ
jgi:uncharacterized protein (TIGR02147 family)